MNSRSMIYTVSIIAVAALVVLYLTVFMSPPLSSNEEIIRIGDNDWAIDDDPIVYGKSYWSTYADYNGDETSERPESIKVYYVSYLGGLSVDKEAMLWENTDGNYLTRSLTLNDLVTHWQGSSAVFKFNHQDDYYRIVFSIPQLENGAYKYTDITEAWNEGELYQTTEMW